MTAILRLGDSARDHGDKHVQQERFQTLDPIEARSDAAGPSGPKMARSVGRPRLDFRRDLVPQLRAQGLSWSQIARTTGASIGSVRRAFQVAAEAPRACQNSEKGIL